MSRLDLVDDWLEEARKSVYSSCQLAKLCSVSQSQLRRYFLLKFFRPPQEWLNELRVWDAARLLTEGHSVKSIAFRLGFVDTSHFCRHFSKYFRCSPARYALNHHVNFVREGVGRNVDEDIPDWVVAERSLLSPLHCRRTSRIPRNN